MEKKKLDIRRELSIYYLGLKNMKLFVAIPIILLILVFLVQSSLTEKMELMQVREKFFRIGQIGIPIGSMCWPFLFMRIRMEQDYSGNFLRANKTVCIGLKNRFF